jgi:hypothetical protein
MGARPAILDAAHMQVRGLEINLIPAEINDLGGPQGMAEGEQDHERVTPAVPVPARRLNQPLDLMLGQVLASA